MSINGNLRGSGFGSRRARILSAALGSFGGEGTPRKNIAAMIYGAFAMNPSVKVELYPKDYANKAVKAADELLAALER